MSQAAVKLTRRWTPLRSHAEQKRLIESKAKFKIVPSGRRSGKTELEGKRSIVLRSIVCHDPLACAAVGHPEWYVKFDDPRIGVAAPTRDQCKRIYWSDFKKLIPKKYIDGDPNESMLFFRLKTGTELHCLGMDRPERAEGTPWDHLCLDEYGNMKKETWDEHLEPALNTPGREGSASFIGVPEGRNHYYQLYKSALAEKLKLGDKSDWDVFHWFSADILSPAAIERAKRNLDELTYQQEYEGSFVNFAGLAYYNFRDSTHCAALKKYYNPKDRLIVAFDFNVSPGVAAIGQEIHRLDPVSKLIVLDGSYMTAWMDEVYVPRNSNTIIVCDKIGQKYKDHQGPIVVYGDASGGAKGSAKVLGSDWDLVEQTFKKHFGERVNFEVPRSNPGERERVNAVNSRLFTVSGEVKMMVDPIFAPNIVLDFEGVRLLEGGSGELDKKYDLSLTHLTDAIGYYTQREYPIGEISGGMIDVVGA